MPLLVIDSVAYSNLLCFNVLQMHIVSLKKGLSVSQATEDSAGIAVLGFFINVCDALQIIIPKKSPIIANLSINVLKTSLKCFSESQLADWKWVALMKLTLYTHPEFHTF